MRFRDKEENFSSDIGKSCIEFVAEYLQVAHHYNLSNAQKKQYMHNLLRDDAKRFYPYRVDNRVNNFTPAVQMIDNEYNSIFLQNRVKMYLRGVRLSRFIDEGHNKILVHEKVYKLIKKLSQEVPLSYRGKSHKVEFLRNAIIRYPWATEPLSRIATHGLSFQQIYGELEAVIHLQRQENRSVIREKASGSSKK